ncbi:MAG: AraC family ligand binding domain-containing protein, partial [Vallitaleaceae bacterium]|nr:AraC family ligand binding domain-containing protein [Vallitaleaceae bacterium]
MLLETEVIDKDTEANYAFISTLKETTGLHSHDFYEFFLVTKGKMRHHVNEKEQILSEGALVFVRPEDAHYYSAFQDFQCSFINLAFSKSLINSLFSYLGDSFPSVIFLSPSYPPVV